MAVMAAVTYNAVSLWVTKPAPMSAISALVASMTSAWLPSAPCFDRARADRWWRYRYPECLPVWAAAQRIGQAAGSGLLRSRVRGSSTLAVGLRRQAVRSWLPSTACPSAPCWLSTSPEQRATHPCDFGISSWRRFLATYNGGTTGSATLRVFQLGLRRANSMRVKSGTFGCPLFVGGFDGFSRRSRDGQSPK